MDYRAGPTHHSLGMASPRLWERPHAPRYFWPSFGIDGTVRSSDTTTALCSSARAFGIFRRSMRRTAQALGVDLVAIQPNDDHLHLMIHYPPHLGLSQIVKRLKGASSRHVRAQRLPEVTRKLWSAHFWSPSFVVVSYGGAPMETVKIYVDNQQNPLRKKHRKSASTPNRKNPAPYPPD